MENMVSQDGAVCEQADITDVPFPKPRPQVRPINEKTPIINTLRRIN